MCIYVNICIYVNVYMYLLHVFISVDLCMCVCVLVSWMCSMPYHEAVRIIQPGLQPQAAATLFLDSGWLCAFFKPDDEAACQWQETNYTDTNTNENGQRTDKQGTFSTDYRTFSYLACDTRDLFLPWHKPWDLCMWTYVSVSLFSFFCTGLRSGRHPVVIWLGMLCHCGGI